MRIPFSLCPVLCVAALTSCAATGNPTTDPGTTLTSMRSESTDSTSSTTASVLAPRVPQDNRGLPTEGSFELTLGGSGGNDEEFENGFGSLGLGVGYYLNDEWELVGRQQLAFSDVAPGEDAWNGASRFGIDYNFRGGELIPYIGALFGWVYGNTIDETMTGGPEAGIKWYVKPEAFLQLNAEYQFFFDKDDSLGDLADDGQFFYGLFFGLKF